ncbi:MAG: trigger factor [Oscillospiraceae bacterium]|nr:trigger factor [Oscillospiraceae bacterium]
MSLKSSKKIETNVYELEIAVDGKTFQAAIEKAYQKVKKQVAVPGFRKGKATRGMIEKYYGEEVFYNDAFEILFPEAVEEAVKEANLELIDNPYDVDVPEISKDGLVFTLKALVKPEIEIKGYKGLKVEKGSTEVTTKDVDAQINQMLDRSARFVEVDRKAKKDDMVTIDFEGFVDGVAFEGGKAEGFELTLGSGQFIPGFEDQIIGHKTGEEFDIQVKFPEEYGAADLAGKDATFKIKLHIIKEKELPALDDEFAKDVSEFDTLKELKADTKKHLQEQKAEQVDTEFENAILEQLAGLVKGEIPEVMYEKQIDDSINEFGYQMQSQGMDLEMYLKYTGMKAEDLRESFKDRAEMQVKCKLALEKIAELEKVEVTAEDVDARINQMAADYGVDADVVRKAFGEEDIARDLKSTKALDIVKAAVKVTEKKAAAKKTAEKKADDEEKPAKKPAAKKTAAKKADDAEEKPAKKPAAKKATAKKADDAEEKPAKKTAAKKPAAKKTTKKTEE